MLLTIGVNALSFTVIAIVVSVGGGRFLRFGAHGTFLVALQPLPAAGFGFSMLTASFLVALQALPAAGFAFSVLTAPALSPVQPLPAQPATERPAPAIRLAMPSPARSFFTSCDSIIPSICIPG